MASLDLINAYFAHDDVRQRRVTPPNNRVKPGTVCEVCQCGSRGGGRTAATYSYSLRDEREALDFAVPLQERNNLAG